jgi:hypothetical protein
MFELEYEREVANDALKDLNVQPILFEVFPSLSETPREAYLEAVRECDVFVLILWKSFSQAVIQEYREAVKKSKPILILLKSLDKNESRDNMLEEFINDLVSGEKGIHFRHTVFKMFRSLAELRGALRESVINEIGKFYEDPVHTLSKEEMYELGTSIIKTTQNRLYLYQRTPSLFLGARNYLSNQKGQYAYEVEFAETLEKWINDSCQYNDKELMYLFSGTTTKAELEENSLLSNTEYIERVVARLRRYKNIEEETGFRFRFSILATPISGPMIIGDNRYAIWILGREDAVSLSQENEKISSILIRMLKTHCQTLRSVDETLSIFGIQH